MGVGVSDWRLARAVSQKGQLGVVSGTALDTVLVRRLQDGDPGGYILRALAAFPIPRVASWIQDRYYRRGGRLEGEPYELLPMDRAKPSALKQRVTAVANFVEVFLAKEGHEGLVGVNYLAKVQLPTLASLYGAMLADVDYVLMGAGIPREIPGVLDRLADKLPVSIRLDVLGLSDPDRDVLRFDPETVGLGVTATLNRPKFLPIVASNSLVTMLIRKANGRIDGFVIEGATAGGHNAPPRGKMKLDEGGEPIYGPRDAVNLAAVAEEGLPFWVAGGTGSPERLAEVKAAGAAGIQVGTLFAYCDESGFSADIKQDILRRSVNGPLQVKTDHRASPTGFPFKAVEVPGTASEQDVYEARKRICDLGYLRTLARGDDGKLRFRCPSEPVGNYVNAGGEEEETVGRKCLCNSLLANIGMAQTRDGALEPRFLTSGDELATISEFLQGRDRYSAADVIDYLLS
ncbi:MAG: nitronate monooxygenase [Rhodothermales bacterium]|jgi:nitronate monooxygenase